MSVEKEVTHQELLERIALRDEIIQELAARIAALEELHNR